MIFGNLTSVLEGDNTIYEQLQANQSGQRVPGRLSKIFYTLSHYGMNWSGDVVKNMTAVPADKLLQNKDEGFIDRSIWTGTYDNWKSKPEEDKPFREKTLEAKRDMLRKMAQQPELEDILDIMANECIVYDDENTYIAEAKINVSVLQQLNEKFSEEIHNAVTSIFYKMYMLLDWRHKAWDMFKRWLIDGVASYEIIYDNLEDPHSIIGIVDVDPATLTRVIDNGIQYWIQFKDVLGKERRLLDSQIIYIKYQDSGVVDRQSYLERLIRPFNIYRIIEQAQVIWTVTQSSFKTMFTIPVNGMNKAKGSQTLNAAMNRYKEDINFNQETGELLINGSTNLPFNKEYWMPENENGTPSIETLTDQGPSLMDSDQLKYFLSKLYKISKIPENRFDREGQATWFGSDISQMLRDEINFSRFVSRLRNVFAEVILKPIRIQVALQIPEMKNDKRILDAIYLEFISYNQFNELMNMEVGAKRIEWIQSLKDTFTTTDAEGNEESYFSQKFLIMRYLGMNNSDLEFNEKCKREEAEANKSASDEGEDESGDMGGESEMGGSEEGGDMGSEESGGDEGSAMMGDVEPDSADMGGGSEGGETEM